MPKDLSERAYIVLIAAVQFVNVLDFMIVMPLGPDFAAAFGVENSRLGFVGASYTFSAALSGIAGSTFLDRFDRKRALLCALLGLVVATAAAGAVDTFETMLVARCVAGMFGGPASALSLAIVSDVIPPERRGRAMGTVLGAFAVASVLGVPAGLELAHLGGWRMPFFAVALVGLLVLSAVFVLMPPLTRHLGPGARPKGRITELLRRPEAVAALGASALVMLGHFTLVPNLAAFFQFNYGYPRDGLGLLYFVGGSISFATMRVAGWLADRVGTTRVVGGATVFYVAVLFFSFISPAHVVPVLVLFAGFMITSSFRAVPMRALSSRVPFPEQRARYMSSQSVVDHLAGATGALLGSSQLHERVDGHLDGMDRLAWITVGLSLSVPLLLAFVERRVRHREIAAAAAAPPAPTPPVHLEVS